MSGEGKLKVVINKPACCGYGVCAEICPEVYLLDENGIVYVDNEIVPEGLEDAAREGADACPQNAIKLVAA
ncbi:MAG: ferredoxin [Sphingomonadales bacterium]|jgi:ferredoxin|nr:ferredoxin [Sphingomonadales bacterium]